MIYAVIDTNVFVAALLSRHADAATVQVVASISKRGICPLYNQEILEEYTEVFSRSKFGFPSWSVTSIINKVKDNGISTERTHSTEHFPDPKDVVFYEVTL